jgi:hypothetical protein
MAGLLRKLLSGWPTSFGDKKASVFLHQGPVAYAQVVINAGQAVAGGDVVTDTEAGIRYFDWLDASMGSDDGQYRISAFVANRNTPGQGTAAMPSRTVRLRWMVTATGAEVGAGVDLSARTVRLFAIGPKG